jgi:muramoyltetrapeptide carboxypeptidase LdcA involved in peptidoglycan recycling
MRIIKPSALVPGDTIGVVTPSTPANVLFREKHLHGITVLESMGLKVKEGKLTKTATSQGYRSGTPQERADEFMDLIFDDEVKCIISTIGGMNSSSMIPYLDFDAIRKHPKIFCGYSDVTSLHLAILHYAGVSTFYGPAVMASFGEYPTVVEGTKASFLAAVSADIPYPRELKPFPEWSDHFLDAKTGAWKTEPRKYQKNDGWKILSEGEVTAPIIVTNLSTLLAAAGTPYFPDLRGRILLLESMYAHFAQEERDFRQLQLMAVFDIVSGLIIGKPEVLNSADAPFTYDELIMEIVGPRTYPIISNFDCGHTVPMHTIAEMSLVNLSATNSRAKATMLEPMVT